MLDTIRAYTRERLAEREETAAIIARLVTYMVETVRDALQGGQHRAVSQRLDHERDEIRSAIDWELQADDAETVGRLLTPLFTYWRSRGRSSPAPATSRPASGVERLAPVELLIAANPDPDSRLPYLLRLPLGRRDGVPHVRHLAAHESAVLPPGRVDEWPDDPEIVERVPMRSCARRGAAIDLVLDRGRENRSQIVFTTARGRDVVFWQSPRTRKQARPNVRTPTARAAGIADLEIVVDTREQYAYRFADPAGHHRQAGAALRRLRHHRRRAAGRRVERKSLADLVSSLITGKLRFALGELAALPRAAVVVEDRYSQIFKLDRVRPAVVADGLAELQVRWPDVPIVFCETRQLAEEWTYRFLAAAHAWADTEHAAIATYSAHSTRIGRTRRRTRRADTLHRRSPRLGTRNRTHRPRPRTPPPRDLGRLASSPRKRATGRRLKPGSQLRSVITHPGTAPTNAAFRRLEYLDCASLTLRISSDDTFAHLAILRRRAGSGTITAAGHSGRRTPQVDSENGA